MLPYKRRMNKDSFFPSSFMRPEKFGGLFTCLISIILSISPSSAEGPSKMKFATQPTHQTAVLGSTVVLPCRIIAREGTVQWTRDGFGLGTIRRLQGFDRYSMIGSDEEGDFSLRISPVTLEDDSEYQCQVSSKRGPKLRSRVARLKVFVPPQSPTITPSPEVSATAGVNVTIKCDSVGGRPAPEIQWLDDSAGMEMREGIEYSEHRMEDGLRVRAESTITFAPNRRHHSQTLTCLTHNPALNEPLAAQVTLRVEFPPEVDLNLEPAELLEGSEVIVSCIAEANPTDVKYKWLRRGKEIIGATEPTLNLGVLTRSDHGSSIACEATNPVGTIRRTQSLNIRYTPRFDSAPSSKSAKAGTEVTLRCNVDGNPRPEITWHHTESNAIVGHGSTLSLKASKETAGTYVCIALSRGFSPLEGKLHLRLQGPPIISMSRSIAARIGHSAELRCEATAIPHPLTITWMRDGSAINPDPSGRVEISEKQRADGVLSLLRINVTEDKDFATYNCSVLNEHGVDFREIILRKQAEIPIFFIIGGGIGVIIIVIAVVSFILCGRKKSSPHNEKTIECSQGANELAGQHRSIVGSYLPKQTIPQDSMKNDVTILPPILNPDMTSLTTNSLRPKGDLRLSDNDSDTKEIETRTASSLSAADRESEHWDGSDKSAGGMQHPLQYPRYSQSTIFSPQEPGYRSYVEYARDYSPVLIGGDGYHQFKLGGPYARSSPASDPSSSLPSSTAPPPYTPTPNGLVGVNGLTSRSTVTQNGRLPNGVTGVVSASNHIPSVTAVPLRHDLIADLQQPDLTREVNSQVRLDLTLKSQGSDSSKLHSKFILPPQANVKPGTLV